MEAGFRFWKKKEIYACCSWFCCVLRLFEELANLTQHPTRPSSAKKNDLATPLIVSGVEKEYTELWKQEEADGELTS